ncbi:MAG: signal peptidase I [bacterium]|nr:signal peptidase I [bacterium]
MKDNKLILTLYILTLLRLVLCFIPRHPKWAYWRNIGQEYLDSFIMAGLVAILIITFVVRSFYIPSESMVPTLLVNDYILVNKFVYHFSTPSRGEIVVFHPPHVDNPEAVDFIKRCIAVENDVVEINNGVLYLNGLAMREPFIKEPPVNNFGPYRVPPGHVFMLGDNRNNSDDSRFWGPLPLKNVVGKAEFIFWPFRRSGSLYPSEPDHPAEETAHAYSI